MGCSRANFTIYLLHPCDALRNSIGFPCKISVIFARFLTKLAKCHPGFVKLRSVAYIWITILWAISEMLHVDRRTDEQTDRTCEMNRRVSAPANASKVGVGSLCVLTVCVTRVTEKLPLYLGGWNQKCKWKPVCCRMVIVVAARWHWNGRGKFNRYSIRRFQVASL